jgi:hypothetical protein
MAVAGVTGEEIITRKMRRSNRNLFNTHTTTLSAETRGNSTELQASCVAFCLIVGVGGLGEGVENPFG